MSLKRTLSLIMMIVLCVSTLSLYSCRKELEDGFEVDGFVIRRDSIWNDETEQFEKIDSYLIREYNGTEKNVVLPDKAPNGYPIKAIVKWAFYKNLHIESIVIPDSYEEILSNAFCELENLKSVYIGKGARDISPWENFSVCWNLETIEVDPENPFYYSEGNCIIERETNSLLLASNHATIPDGVEWIQPCAFYGRESMKEIRIPKSVKIIDEWAFFGCLSLKKVELYETVEKVNDLVFVNCPALTVYCEHSAQPEEWGEIWCKSSPEARNQYPFPDVIWGADLE